MTIDILQDGTQRVVCLRIHNAYGILIDGKHILASVINDVKYEIKHDT